MRAIAIALLAVWIGLATCPVEPASKRGSKSPSKKSSCIRKSSKAKAGSKAASAKAAGKFASPKKTVAKPSTSTGSVNQIKEESSAAKIDSASLLSCPVPEGAYTSLVIDASGFKLDKSLTSRIFRRDGSEVWGTLKNLKDEDYTLLEERGMVGYATTVEEAKSNPRCGARPLVVRAVDMQGTPLRSNTVVSDEDAERILAENAKSKFLERFNVILVRNENPVPPASSPVEDGPSSTPSSNPQTPAPGSSR
ncbi:MAG: hypothetical protein ACP5R5_03435 [Armatimonadota bacterium]